MSGQDAGEITGGSEAICFFIAWAHPGETEPLFLQTRGRTLRDESQGGEYSLSFGSEICD